MKKESFSRYVFVRLKENTYQKYLKNAGGRKSDIPELIRNSMDKVLID